MNRERMIRAIAGAFVLLGLFLGWKAEWNPLFTHEYALWMVAFVGANLFQSSLTCLCPLDFFLKKLGVKGAGE